MNNETKHTQLLKELITLIKDKELEVIELEIARLDQLQHAARGANDDVGSVGLELLLVGRDRHATVDDKRLDVAHVLLESVELLADLVGQLARVAQDKRLHFSGHGVDLVERRQHEDGRLTHARLGLAEHIDSEDRLRNALVLYCVSSRGANRERYGMEVEVEMVETKGRELTTSTWAGIRRSKVGVVAR